MKPTERNSIIKECRELHPEMTETTEKIIKEMMFKKDNIGQYIVRSKSELLSLIEYLEENSACFHKL